MFSSCQIMISITNLVLYLFVLYFFHQRYYSSILDAFFSLTTNMYGSNNIEFKYDDAIDFVLFSTITSNGTDCICEIVRILVESQALLSPQKRSNSSTPTYDKPCSFFHHEQQRSQRLYNILVQFGNRFFDKNLGSCKVKRHVYCSKGLPLPFTFDFKNLKVLLKSIRVQFNRTSNTNVNDLHKKLVTDLEALDGFGPVVTQNFVQLAALVGLIPLEMYNCASLDTNTSNQSRGPCKLISYCLEGTPGFSEMPKKKGCLVSTKCEEVLTQLHAELNHLWKTAISRGYVENSMCELWRSFPFMKNTKGGKSTKNGDKSTEKDETLKEPTSHEILQSAADSIEKKGFDNLKAKVKECIYIHRNRCRGRSVQALFRVVNNSSSAKLQMFQHVFTGKTKSHYVERSWIYSDKEKSVGIGSQNLMEWDSNDVLKLDSFLRDRFVSKTRVCGSNGCMLCRYSVKTSPEMITVDGKKFTLTPVEQSLNQTHSQNLKHVFDSKLVLASNIKRVVKKVDEKKKKIFQDRQRQEEIESFKTIQAIRQSEANAKRIKRKPSPEHGLRKRKASQVENGNRVGHIMELEFLLEGMDHSTAKWRRKPSDGNDSDLPYDGCLL